MMMTEIELLAAVVDVIETVDQLKGPRALVWHHCGDSRRCIGHRGFPDLVIAGRRGIIVAELKSAHGETSADQDLWLWMLDQAVAGVPIRIWMPRDLDNGSIREEIESIA